MRAVFPCLVALLLQACATSQSPACYPGEVWTARRTASFAGRELNRLDAAVRSGSTHSMLVVKDGLVIYTYGDVAEQEPTYVASVRKSILSMMLGQWVDRGEIDLEATLAELDIDDVGGLSDLERTATLRDLISARSGIYHSASNASGVNDSAPERYSMLPGAYYWYNNWDFNAAGAIFERVSGQDIYVAFEEMLAGPLELQDFDLDRNMALGRGEPASVVLSDYPPYYFFLSTRDMARIGLLMARNGSWNGRQIISRPWIAESTSLVTPNAEMNPDSLRDSEFGYGYMWWVFDPAESPEAFHGGYAARGHYGQYIVVLPELDLVIAHKTAPQPAETPEAYEAINVSWDEMRELVSLSVALAERAGPAGDCRLDAD